MRSLSIGLLVWGALQSAARASPLYVQVIGQVGTASVNDTEPLSDPSQGVNIYVPNIYVPESTVLAPSGPGGNGGPGANSPIDLLVSVSGPNDGSPSEQNWVEITGTTSGFSPPGSISGMGASARLELAQGASPADIPPYLADLLNHPERIHYNGEIISPPGQYPASLQSELWIAPPVDPNAEVPTPEPSMLMIALTLLTGVPVARRLRLSRP